MAVIPTSGASHERGGRRGVGAAEDVDGLAWVLAVADLDGRELRGDRPALFLPGREDRVGVLDLGARVVLRVQPLLRGALGQGRVIGVLGSLLRGGHGG
ncbi:MAG TPA: hypothetical protein VGH76_09740, partial [Actinomycetospora sp.]|uniref:hypothetical protein n=1 Tax=Actinomycetospora sp. TaxID=1872135 RepID=UPI002F4097F1